MNAHPEFPCVTVDGFGFWMQAALVCNTTHGNSSYFCDDCTPGFHWQARAAGCCPHRKLSEAQAQGYMVKRQSSGTKRAESRLVRDALEPLKLPPGRLAWASRAIRTGVGLGLVGQRLGLTTRQVGELERRLSDG